MATLQSIDNNIKTFTVNNLSICHLPYGTYESEHVHNGIEIVYIVNGMGEHCINGKKYNVKKGSVIIVNPFELHCFTAIDNFEYYNLNFECAFLSE